MSEQLDIVVTSIDVGAAEAAKRLAQAFDLSALEAEQFVRELPRVVKRNASREEAERYVEALRAIGARVETLASEAPRSTMRARMLSSPTDKLVIATDPEPQPAMRFRAGGHLGMISVPPYDVLHPSFPKAPLIPHDLSRMPNGGELPMPSIRPASSDDENGAYDADGEPRRHTDAQPPPPLVLGVRDFAKDTSGPQTPAAATRSGKPNAKPTPASAKPSGGAAPAAAPSSAAEPRQGAARAESSSSRLIVGLLLLAVAGFSLARCFG